jgi:hypothetical protein
MNVRRALVVACLCIPAHALAQSTHESIDVCNHTLRLVRGTNDRWSLHGASTPPTTLAVGTPAFERVSVGPTHAVIVTIRDTRGPRQGALVACQGTRAPAVLWSGDLQWRGEDLGDRVRHALLVEGGTVSLVEQHETRRVCGLDALTTTRRNLDGATSTLLPGTPDDAFARTPTTPLTALPIASSSVGYAPSSAWVSAGDRGALFDADPATHWQPGASGYVTVTFPSTAFELRALDLMVPAGGARHFALWLGAVTQRYEVTVPATTTPRVFRATLPSPIAARCFTLVARTGADTLASLAIRSALDDPHALETLVRAADVADGDEAALLLIDLGAAGVRALADALPTLSRSGARRALRLLATRRSPGVIDALVQSLTRADVADDAAAALRRMGPLAWAPVARAAATSPQAATLVGVLPATARQRLDALTPALGAEAETWRAARVVMAAALASATDDDVRAWLAALPDDAVATSRALHLASEHLGTERASRADVANAALTHWTRNDAFEVRYRLVAALAGSESGRVLLGQVLGAHSDHDLRAEAARALATVATSTDGLVRALNDRVPRVRAAAAHALTGRDDAREALATTLARDPWPSVRAAAAGALANDPNAAPALIAALGGTSVPAVRSVIAALGHNPGPGTVAALVAFVDDARHNPTLRLEAVEALAEHCDHSSANDLERIASTLMDPVLPPWEQAIGHAALASLARIDGARARALLARSEANAVAVSAVERAAQQRCEARAR